jgi:hypothetical protein
MGNFSKKGGLPSLSYTDAFEIHATTPSHPTNTVCLHQLAKSPHRPHFLPAAFQGRSGVTSVVRR